MVKRIKGRLTFVFNDGPKQHIKYNFKLSLIGILLGIFLLPNLAYLSTITPEEIINLTNQERKAAGLSALTANQLLTQAAMAKGEAILELQTFKHNINDRKFSAWVRDTGYNYSYVGENLALDFVTSPSVIEAWKNSPLHKKNLLSPYYQEIGVAAIDGKFQGQNTTIVVQIFGSPAIGTFQPLTKSSNINSLSLNTNLSKIDLVAYELKGQENLLTHSILNQKFLPAYDNKLIVPAENILDAEPYKFIIQPESYTTANNFLLTFTFLILTYLLIFLYYYYFLKINRLTTV